ncbi:hypothetical protein [Paraburkholderia hospita]|nr:hypothetical protein [Paraburkholderia hospita]
MGTKVGCAKRVCFASRSQTSVPATGNSKRSSWFSILLWSALLLLMAGMLFFLSAELSEVFKEAIEYYNDSKQHHGIREWAAFYGSVIMAGSAWLPLYLVFKICEKKLVDAGVRSTQ